MTPAFEDGVTTAGGERSEKEGRPRFWTCPPPSQPLISDLSPFRTEQPDLNGESIYILECADGSYYTGITRRSVAERVTEQAQGLIPGCYTFTRRPAKLVFDEHYERIADKAKGASTDARWPQRRALAFETPRYARLLRVRALAPGSRLKLASRLLPGLLCTRSAG